VNSGGAKRHTHGQHGGRIGGAPYWYCGSVPVGEDGALGVLWLWAVVDRLAVRALAPAAAAVKAMPRTMAALNTNFVRRDIVKLQIGIRGRR
jgi:hypothetical protein